MPEKFLRRVWGTQAGYVFLPSKTGEWKESPPIPWPTDDPLSFDLHADCYFCPNVFTKPKRLEENVGKLYWLYADLDAVDPRKLDLPPTIAIRTSPGRFQGLWKMKKGLTPSTHRDLNRRLTYATGADKGGWPLTKVLLLPGSKNVM